MREKTLEELRKAVVDGNVEEAKRLAEEIIKLGIPANTAVDTLMAAMKIVDKRYERREYFVIDVASSASAMREALKTLTPHLNVEPATIKGKIVIGSLKGNIQSLGKDVVAAVLQTAGFQVIDLGINVNPEDFVETAVVEKAQIIAISVSMEETVPHLREIADLLKKKNLQNKIKTIIGGNAVTEETRRNYGLDAYAPDAQTALKKIRSLLSQKPCTVDDS